MREKDLLALEKKCEHHATETAMSNAREMQKQAAKLKSAKDAGKNKGKSVILLTIGLRGGGEGWSIFWGVIVVFFFSSLGCA